MLIEWKEIYATGIADIDYEHRGLIDLINALHEKMLAAGAAEQANAYFAELFNNISSHFALEEQMMKAAAYDQFREHKADHEVLLDELRDMMDEYDDDPAAHDADALSVALDKWFSEHFRIHDSRLHKKLGK